MRTKHYSILLLFIIAISAKTFGAIASPGKMVFIYKGCTDCHGNEGDGGERYKAPKIAGQEEWYISARLRKFKNEIRGVNAKDDNGKIMASVSQSLSDKNIDDVARYLSRLNSNAKHTLTDGNKQNGKNLYEKHCTVCHGDKAQGNPLLKSPKLAGIND